MRGLPMLLAAQLTACMRAEPEARPVPSDSVALPSVVVDSPTVAAGAALGVDACVPVGTTPLSSEVPQAFGDGHDDGRGLVIPARMRPGVAATAEPWADAVVVRAAPDRGSATVATLRVSEVEAGSCGGIDVPAGAVDDRMSNIVSFREYYHGRPFDGLPADSVTADSAWARVLYAVDRAQVPSTGWVELRAGAATFMRWADVLAATTRPGTDAVTLRGPWRGADGRSVFHTARAGAAVDHPVGSDDRSWLALVRFEGEWAQVRVHEGDECAGGTDKTIGTYWVRAIDDRGRPLLFSSWGAQCD